MRAYTPVHTISVCLRDLVALMLPPPLALTVVPLLAPLVALACSSPAPNLCLYAAILLEATCFLNFVVTGTVPFPRPPPREVIPPGS